MQGRIDNISIRGIVSAVPCNEVCNLDYVEKIQNRRIKKQVVLTGINNRRVAIGGQKASDLAAVAADDLLKRLKWDRDSIKVMIFVTQSPDLARPASAFLIQERLKLSKDCLIYDINLGCAGYVAGVTTICSILQCVKGRGLLLVGESNAISGEDIGGTALLEGDAAAATAFEYTEGVSSTISFTHYSDGSRAHYLYTPLDKGGFMDGNAILLFGLSDVANSIKKYMQEFNIEMESVDYFVFHQAQKMIIDGIVSEVKIPEEKVLMSCADFGNTSSASIPLTLCVEFEKKKIQGKKRIIMCGFGIGLSWGIVQMDIDSEDIFPLIETDYIYDDKKKFECGAKEK